MLNLVKKVLPKVVSLPIIRILYKTFCEWKKEKKHTEFEYTIFRNDDVSFDTNVEHFKKFCEVFHKAGYVQLHGINLYGRTNCRYIIDGVPAMYDTIAPTDTHNYDILKSVATDYIGDNKELIDYINKSPDHVALHGLYHSDYSLMSYEQQDRDIKEGLRLLHLLFPDKKIDTFIAPFNRTNECTYQVCKKYGLRVSAEEGEHLEDMIHNQYGKIKKGQLYRYHHHRFYPESTFFYYDLTIEKLENYLAQFKNRKPRICLLCDRPNWAHDHSAQELVRQLSDEFILDIRYVIDNPIIRARVYDAILIFFWGEDSYKKYHFPKKKVIKQVSSHRWQDNPLYGPCTPRQFYKRYLKDSATIICPSKILYSLLRSFCKNLFLCGKGYSPLKFYYKGERKGEMSICMAGNIEDPVKGVKEILIPAADGYKLDMKHDMKHEALCDFYNVHDIYVVSSLHEADPLPLLESMACGCFPVASAIGIAPELIRHKENGYIVSERSVEAFREAFQWCNENLDYIREQGKKNAEEIYHIRRWSVMAENYRLMFREHLQNISSRSQ